ncbi:TPA: type II secretion system minor pseudopilin GspJ [Photobacterium damselae]
MSRINNLHSARNKGFTLLEVLVAIGVFAMLSLSAYQVLNGVQRSNVQSQEHNQRISEIQRAMIIMGNDFSQIVARQTRSNDEEPSKKLVESGEYLLDSSSQGILFARDGWQNPEAMFPRGDVTKVGYRIVDDNLERVWFRYPDNTAGTEPLVKVILPNVTEMKLEFYTDKRWIKNWDSEGKLPEGIKVTLKLKDFGYIDRVFVLPKAELENEQNKAES